MQLSPGRTRDAQGRAQKMLKNRTSVWLWLIAAFLSFIVSIYLWFWVDREQGMFVGLWVPSILSLGVLLNSLKAGRA